MNVVGQTKCGKQVVDGVFFLQTSIGLPLDIIVEELKSRNMVPAWDRYVVDALNGDWFGDTIYKSMIQQGLDEDMVKIVMTRVLQEYKYPDEM